MLKFLTTETLHINTLFVDITGDIRAAILLSKLLDYSYENKYTKHKDSLKWVVKSRDNWGEIRLSAAEFDKAKAILENKGYIVSKRFKEDDVIRLYMRVVPGAVKKAIMEIIPDDLVEEEVKVENTEKNKKPKETKISNEVREIYECWIENCKHINNAQLNEKLIKNIKATVDKYGCENIKAAIINYSKVYNDERFFYKAGFTLFNFLRQRNTINRFVEGVDEAYNGDIWATYKNQKLKYASANIDDIQL